MTQEYDIAIVGGGPGGYVGAIHAAQLGAKVALIEKDRLGGTCLNRGCIPTKTMVHSVEVYNAAREGKEFGVNAPEVSFDFGQMMAHKTKVSDQLVNGVYTMMKFHKVDVIPGEGKIATPRVVRVGDQEVRAKKLVLATGSVPARVPIPGVELPGVVNSDQLLQLDKLPTSLIIVGGGVIGMEFACIFASLGTKVTVVEMLPMILPLQDDEIARRFLPLLRKQGIGVNMGAAVKTIEPAENGGLKVSYESAGQMTSVEAELVLMATGRIPFTEGLGQADLGIEMNRRAIKVNNRLETSIDGIYAIGDVNAFMMLAHVASYQGEVAVENALGHAREADYRSIPYGVYTAPEIGGVGMMEKDAKAQGIEYTVSRFPYSASGRALTMGETAGMVKLICAAEGDRKVLGCHILGARATDVVAELGLAIQAGVTARELAHTIHAHPTLSENVMEAAMAQFEGSVHYARM